MQKIRCFFHLQMFFCISCAPYIVALLTVLPVKWRLTDRTLKLTSRALILAILYYKVGPLEPIWQYFFFVSAALEEDLLSH